MTTYKPTGTEYQRMMLMSMLDSYLANASDEVRGKCIEYSVDPTIDIPVDVQNAIDLVDVVRDEYNSQLEVLRDKYEVRLKMALAMLVDKIDKAS